MSSIQSNIGLLYTLLISSFGVVVGDTFAECENIEPGSFIGGRQGCNSYVYCDGEDSYEGTCPSDLLFNTADGSCAPANEVDCVDGDSPQEVTTVAPPSTTTTTITTIATSLSTNGEASIPNETSSPASDPIGTQSTNSPLSTSTLSSPLQTCPPTDNLNEIVFLPSDVSCSEYYVCYHGIPVPMSCSGYLYFDYITSKCDFPDRVNCKIATATTSNPRKMCTANMFDYFPYPKNCNYFYKCINGFLSLQQCPIGFGWSEEMRLCLKLHNGQCPTSLSDLQLYNHEWHL